jgi:CRISPR-associated endonuclease/helicase Cas3
MKGGVMEDATRQLPLVAHSPNDVGNWHLLEDHLRGTAQLAEGFAERFAPCGQTSDLTHLAKRVALVHDAGKASAEWQSKLRSIVAAKIPGPVGIDHKAVGCEMLRRAGAVGLGLLVDGHHGGLRDAPFLKGVLDKPFHDPSEGLTREGATNAVRALLGDEPESQLTLPSWMASHPIEGDVALRMLYSALVDADFLDTAQHFRGNEEDDGAAACSLADLAVRFEAAREQMLRGRTKGATAHMRAKVYDDCLEAAAAPPSIFRLAAPTGSGKTLAAAGFALNHAACFGHDRVVVAVPYISITEQNAAVYRSMLDPTFGERVVLEHHSSVDLDQPGHQWQRLAAENWDAPFIVTTTVQLLQSLHDRRPSAMRKVHRLARSVIVLDEVQALPEKLLVPILSSLKALVARFGTTVLLASATQPSLQYLSRTIEPGDLTEIGDAAPRYDAMRRVRYEWMTDPGLTLAQVAGEVASERQALVVVNTTKDARRLVELLHERAKVDVVHLSTRMCTQHRRDVLTSCRQRLDDDEPVLLVATQLVEAGVDIDFPVVFRAMAPADSLQQAAGRANREGRRSELGRVVVFDAVDAGAPKSYQTKVALTKSHFGEDKADPDDLDQLDAYYRELYLVLDTENGSIGAEIDKHRKSGAFQTVTEGPLIDATRNIRDRSKGFQLIDDDGMSVVVDYGTEDDRRERRRILADIRGDATPSTAALRRLEPFTARLSSHVLKSSEAQAQCVPVLGSLVEWTGRYDDVVGIIPEIEVEDYVL